MDIRQTRGLLGDKIALAKERLTYTRPRTLSQAQCENIVQKIDTLIAILPSMGENEFFDEPRKATITDLKTIIGDSFKHLQ
jgi:hypothetical protein